MNLSSRVITDTRAFESLAHEWDELLESSDQRCYFMRWHWNFRWWTHLAPSGSQLRIVECRNSEGMLVGLSPMYLRSRKVFKVIPIRELLFIGTGVGLKTSEYLDVAVRQGYENSAPRSMALALNGLDDWDRLSCVRVPEESPVMRQFVTSFRETASWQSFESAPFIDTSEGWTGYKATLGRSMRRNVEYYARRLFKRHRCEFQRVQTEEELQIALDALVPLHIAHWRSRGTIGSLSQPLFQRFLVEVASQSFAENRLRVWMLRIEGRVEAVLLGFLDRGVLHYFQKGHNPAFSKEDLGTALVSLCVRDCCEDPQIRAFDFMGGGAEYKTMWARQTRGTVVSEVNRNTIRTRAFALQHQLDTTATAFYRLVTPPSLRAMRRDWINARSIRESSRRFKHHVTAVLGATSTLGGDVLEWASAVPVAIGLDLTIDPSIFSSLF